MTTATKRPVTVSVIGDHELVVAGLAAMLALHEDAVQFVEIEALESLMCPIDVVLVDTCADQSGGRDVIKALTAHPCVGRVALWTWALTDDVIQSARDLGVEAALPKSLDAEGLVRALSLIRAGQADEGEARLAPVVEIESWRDRRAGLTVREAEVVALVTSGVSNSEIAERTFLSINSVKSYIRAAYRTMGVSSRSQAVLWGIDHGMAPTRMSIALPEGQLTTGA